MDAAFLKHLYRTSLVFAFFWAILALYVPSYAVGEAEADPVVKEPSPLDAFWQETQPETIVILELKTEEKLKGVYKGQKEDQILFGHEAMGEIEIPQENIKSAKIFVPEKKKIWSSEIQAGANGSAGNTQNFSLRASANTKRETERHKFTGDITYNLDYNRDNTTNVNKNTGNRLILNLNNDWYFKSLPRLSYFVGGTYEYDEFQDFDQRIYGNTGLGYKIVDMDIFKLNTRAGAGYIYKWGPPANEQYPEGLFGLDLVWTPTKTQEITASTEIFPNLKDLGEFRAVNKANWKLFFSEAKTLALNLGVEHRYDSQPGTSKANDIDYFALISWAF